MKLKVDIFAMLANAPFLCETGFKKWTCKVVFYVERMVGKQLLWITAKFAQFHISLPTLWRLTLLLLKEILKSLLPANRHPREPAIL